MELLFAGGFILLVILAFFNRETKKASATRGNVEYYTKGQYLWWAFLIYGIYGCLAFSSTGIFARLCNSSNSFWETIGVLLAIHLGVLLALSKIILPAKIWKHGSEINDLLKGHRPIQLFILGLVGFAIFAHYQAVTVC